ncbi:hypothetical protein PSHT_00187 [Puccinia striiformis]|uniref:Uncharacterized protein n=1 Tax=Puccinia striiformis TaxID=27350 RepID=A0A2S4WNS9_9BASI|nr:hypothetical protein PSHT_00187 [Puccinia striiformis]
MLSFNLFIVLAFLLITTQVISAKGFVCPVPNSNKAKQTHAYCTRSITDQEKKDNKIEQCYTVWSKFQEVFCFFESTNSCESSLS